MKNRWKFLVLVVVLGMMLVVSGSFSFAQTPDGINKLVENSTGDVEITWNDKTGKPSFIRGNMSLPAKARQSAQEGDIESATIEFVENYGDLFGISDASQELQATKVETDSLGMYHVTLQQVYQDVNVHHSGIGVHINGDKEIVVAVNNQFIPDVGLSSVESQITITQAVTIAKMALPNGQLLIEPELVIYSNRSSEAVNLVWLVELLDDSLPVRNIYVVDAIDGVILQSIDKLYEGLNRKTYDAENGKSLPGTLVRSEGNSNTGDEDVDNAHNFAGDTYNYYKNSHNRDSYDNKGATIISTANYGKNYKNAFWDGKQMVYGAGMAVKDVVAHELTHAVTEQSANLEYKWQSGALNESFSDIFGVMVDRDDWLLGEDLSREVLSGRPAMRDLADPARFGQPDHADKWKETCSDNQGVHANSGITNKAYYNIATAIGKDKAERIFYRTLTVYLKSTSSLKDARAGTLQSVQDLHGNNSTEYNAVKKGFDDVGITANWSPPENSCSCAARTMLSDDKASMFEVVTTLYRVRDEVLTENTLLGDHYQGLYEEYTGRISLLLLKHTELGLRGKQILQYVTPGLTALVNDKGNEEIITQELVSEMTSYLQTLATDARDNGDHKLADTIDQEMERLDWDKFPGMTYEEARVYIESQLSSQYKVYLPIITR